MIKDRLLYLAEEKEEFLNEEEIEFLSESIKGKLDKIQNKVLKIRVKAKRSLNDKKITPEEFKKIKDFCDDIEKDILLFGNVDNLKGYAKSNAKKKINDLLYKVNKVLNDNAFVEILKKSLCWSVFFSLIARIIFFAIPPVATIILSATGATLATGLVKKIIRKCRELYVRWDGTFDDFKKSVDLAKDQFKERNISDVSPNTEL